MDIILLTGSVLIRCAQVCAQCTLITPLQDLCGDSFIFSLIVVVSLFGDMLVRNALCDNLLSYCFLDSSIFCTVPVLVCPEASRIACLLI